MTPRDVLEQLLAGRSLTEREAEALLGMFTSDDVGSELKAALLVALRAKGETPEEVRGLARAMRAAARPVPLPEDGVPCVDTCGTGGDGAHSFNVSTAAALLCAAGGLRVTKHGNRSVSSRCGSADVLELLGLELEATPEAAARSLVERGFAFLFAPVFHPSMRAVVPVRRALGVRTVFNLLGPLTNPVAPAFQLLGVYAPEPAALLAEALSGLPLERAYVVHGAPAWDEATPVGPFQLWDVRPGRVEHRVVDPLDYGVPRCTPEDLAGGSGEENARLLRELLEGRLQGPIRDAVVLNAGLVLEVTGRAEGAEAVQIATSWLEDGTARAFLEGLA